jgi:hypothetical protein
MTELPADVVEAVRDVFVACNASSTATLTMAPNVQEEWLDHVWIGEVTRFAAPRVVDSGWVVRLDTHYLGGMRHFEHFEIADIGVLVHLRLGEQERKSKVVLSQSKRLYPNAGAVREETMTDYRIGFGRLADPEDERLPIALERVFRFSDGSRYGAIARASEQVRRIERYQRDVGLPVFYHLYNPWEVPMEQRIPLTDATPPAGMPPLGVRVLPASVLHRMLPGASANHPSLADLASADGLPTYGWRLEDFVCDEVLACREGHEYQSIQEESMQALFNRRSGPIAAAIAITIESPDVASAYAG